MCSLWRQIIGRLVRKGLLKKSTHLLKRLKCVESFNESFSIKETRAHSFKPGSTLAAAAEKIHLTNMEIIRLKHPMTLRRLTKIIMK